MSSRRLSRLAAVLLLPLSLAAPAAAQQVVLKVHHFLPGTSNVHLNLIAPWCDRIAK